MRLGQPAGRACWIAAACILLGVTGRSYQTTGAPLTVGSLRTEYRENPIGIDARKPRFSWQLKSAARGVVQSAYEIRVASGETALRAGDDLVWTSGRVASSESIHRVYEGPPLQSARRYYWRVRVWDAEGRPSDWSAAAFWEMGLLAPSDWRAAWIVTAMRASLAFVSW